MFKANRPDIGSSQFLGLGWAIVYSSILEAKRVW